MINDRGSIVPGAVNVTLLIDVDDGRSRARCQGNQSHAVTRYLVCRT